MWNQEIIGSERCGKVDNSQLFPSWKSGNNNTLVSTTYANQRFTEKLLPTCFVFVQEFVHTVANRKS